MSYVKELIKALEDIKEKTIAGMGRTERSELLRVAVDNYALKHAEFNDRAKLLEVEKAEKEGRNPIELPFNPLDVVLLDVAADLFLYEELTDTSSNKIAKYEYPFLSEFQLARRKDGAHEAKGPIQKGESPLSAAATYGQDFRDYKTPTRRKRSTFENIYVDEVTKSRNEERRRRYNEFIKPGPVITYMRGEVV